MRKFEIVKMNGFENLYAIISSDEGYISDIEAYNTEDLKDMVEMTIYETYEDELGEFEINYNI